MIRKEKALDALPSQYVNLLYRSVARWPDLHPSDIDILRQALRFNGPAGVTGFLWRANGQFFQALHGPVAVIDQLLHRIAQDDRHHDVEVLLREPAPPVSGFGDWSMGYDHLLEDQLSLGLDRRGGRPDVSAADARRIFEAMVQSWREARDFGSAFPYARRPGEPEPDFLQRLERAD